jgi:hypothetical protein
MLVMQEDGKLRSYGFALRRHCLIEEMILHLLGQVVSDTDSLKMMAGISPAINANDAIQTARAKNIGQSNSSANRTSQRVVA